MDSKETNTLSKIVLSKKKVHQAGQIIIDPNANHKDVENAIDVIDSWRMLHAQPLELIMKSLNEMKEKKIITTDITIAQRLKTRKSITKKLIRQPKMKLSRMYDIAGCRIIVNTISDVKDIVEKLRDTKYFPHKYVSEKDYMENPKPDGYRCFHYICRFTNNDNPVENDFCVEIQIRTRLQHLWATAVETMSLYTQTDLKASEGPEEILRFFQLSSSLFALDENCKLVPNTPSDLSEINAELRELEQKHQIMRKLSLFSVLTAELDSKEDEAEYYVLELDYASKSLKVKIFPREELAEASSLYSELEAKHEGTKASSVLIASSSFNELKEAYPNYFADITRFNEIIISKSWNPAFMHQGDRAILRKSLAEDIEKNASKLTQFFNPIFIKPILEPDKPDGIGAMDGNVYYALRNSPRLVDSYLRFSAIRYYSENNEMPFDLETLPIMNGNAILLSATGGAYLVQDTKWHVVADHNSFAIQLHDGCNPRLLIMLLLWFKSSSYYWHLLWCGQKSIRNQIIPEKLLQYAITKEFDKEIELFNELILMEHTFIKEFHAKRSANILKDEMNDFIEEHNKKADVIAAKLDRTVTEILCIGKDLVNQMREDLTALNVYQYGTNT